MHYLPPQSDHRFGPVVVRDGINTGAAWAPTHRHRKGGLYRELARGTNESDRSPVVIYDDDSGTIWVRPVIEFDDGRFTPLND